MMRERREGVKPGSVVRKHAQHSPEHPSHASAVSEIEIAPQTGWRWVDWRELWEYRDLLLSFTHRQIRAQYAQSALGIGWAIFPPLFQVAVFTIVFGNIVGINTGETPYGLFSISAIILWNFFSQALNGATNSLVQSSNMLSKVYFPRIILPIAAVVSKLLNLMIALIMLALILLWFQIVPTIWILLLPLLILVIFLAATVAGLCLTAFAVQYRDVKFAQGFLTNLFLYACPIIYPIDMIPEQYHLLYALNPMVGPIEMFRATLFGAAHMPWGLLLVSAIVAVVLFLAGSFYFFHIERIFADVA
jgi:lipopolysaccharide transport system permease protein